MRIEELVAATDEVVAGFRRLLPQLSGSALPLDRAALTRLARSEASTVLLAWDDDETLVGTLTLVTFPTPTGLRAHIEDVVVAEAARGQGIGAALTEHALDLARQAGARTVDLTSRPARATANRLYQRLGFRRRDSNLYRYELTNPG